MAFVPAESSATDARPDFYIVIYKGRLLCREGEAWQPLTPDVIDSFDAPAHRHYLGTLDERHCFAAFFRGEEPSIEGFEWQDLRHQLGAVNEELFQLAGRALQITRWYRDHQFCGVCGGKTREALSDRALVCENCETRFYPRISPCVIGLVIHDNMCLLGRGVRHPEGIYSTLAGFVEPGESAEQAFAREVYEEVGVDIKNIRYFGSQPWPFPGQLMLGFLADYAGGEIITDENEILDAQWFSAESLPRVPPTSTIAGQLIQSFIQSSKA